MAQPRTGQNIIFSGELRLLAGAEGVLEIEIAENFDVEFRFTNLFLTPDSDEILVTSFTLRNQGEKTNREILIGDPVNIKQLANDQRLANGNFLLELLQGIEDNSKIKLGLLSGELHQAVTTRFIIVGQWIDNDPPPDMVERRTAFRDGQERIETQRITPQVGPVISQPPNGGQY